VVVLAFEAELGPLVELEAEVLLAVL